MTREDPFDGSAPDGRIRRARCVSYSLAASIARGPIRASRSRAAVVDQHSMVIRTDVILVDSAVDEPQAERLRAEVVILLDGG